MAGCAARASWRPSKPSRAALGESKVKNLTGGDKISARFMRQDFFEFFPQFKLFVAGNHKPAIRNIDEAMKRRLHLIPFTITVPPERRDKHLQQKLLAERDGILAWAVQGCLDWQRHGGSIRRSVWWKPPRSISRPRTRWAAGSMSAACASPTPSR
jgi:P4 family phage/plasmid primase-like protien